MQWLNQLQELSTLGLVKRWRKLEFGEWLSSCNQNPSLGLDFRIRLLNGNVKPSIHTPVYFCLWSRYPHTCSICVYKLSILCTIAQGDSNTRRTNFHMFLPKNITIIFLNKCALSLSKNVTRGQIDPAVNLRHWGWRKIGLYCDLDNAWVTALIPSFIRANPCHKGQWKRGLL